MLFCHANIGVKSSVSQQKNPPGGAGAERVIDEATVNGNVRNINGKSIYYIDGVANPKKGVVVIVKDGKIQSMMPSDFKSFNKLQ